LLTCFPQLACGHKTVAAVVAFAADHTNSLEVKVLLGELCHRCAGVFHQGKRRHTMFFCGGKVNGAHLFRVRFS